MTTAQESQLLLTANCEYVQLGECVMVAVYRLYITPRFYIIALRLCITYNTWSAVQNGLLLQSTENKEVSDASTYSVRTDRFMHT